MNNKPNDPEECINFKNFSFWTDMRVNYWLLITIVTGAATDLLFHSKLPYGLLRDHYAGWPVMLRAIIELVPLLAGLLWARSMARWIRGMDELHRRITIEAWLFAAIATLGFISIWPLLDRTGVSSVILQATKIHLEALDNPNLPLTVWMLNVFYILGYFTLIRRYK
jgi:hypothetical protein